VFEVVAQEEYYNSRVVSDINSYTMAEIFGFTIKKAAAGKAKSFVPPVADDAALEIGNAAGFFGQYYGAEATPKNDFDLVKKYRTASEHPEADQAI
jgi:hypothetical protein